MPDSSVVLARPRARTAVAAAVLLSLALALALALALGLGVLAPPAGAAVAGTGARADTLARLAAAWRDGRSAVALDRLALQAAQDDLAATQAAYDAADAAVAASGPTRRLDPRDGAVGSSTLFDARAGARRARDDAAALVALRGATLLDATARAAAAEDAVVAAVARRGDVGATELRAEWDATPQRDLDVVAFALAQAGKPYVFAAAGPDAYDCSGLTMAAWATRGVELAHFAATQHAQTQRVRVSDLRPGDLVFFGDDLGHVGLFLGRRLMVHAPHSGDVVRVAPIGGRRAMRTGRVPDPRP